MSNVLDKIVASKRIEIARAKESLPITELRRQLRDAPAARDFAAALRRHSGMHVIAEIKRASPSAGLLRADFEPRFIARVYAEHGADAISVLTDSPFFQGSLSHLAEVRGSVDVPILRKDFILDAYQICEARAHGADAVLLIAEILPGADLSDLLVESRELGMEPLVELHDLENLDRVVDAGARIVGVNNRNLRTFVTDLSHTLAAVGRVPKDRVLVSESGIESRADVTRLESHGIGAILVGETLMRAPDMGKKLHELLGRL
jgi:indole-3-glycerol phosphate synthase